MSDTLLPGTLSPAEQAYEDRINAVAQRVCAAIGGQEEVRVVACALMTIFVRNETLAAAFNDLTGNWMLPLIFKNTRSMFEADRALHDALRRIG